VFRETQLFLQVPRPLVVVRKDKFLLQCCGAIQNDDFEGRL